MKHLDEHPDVLEWASEEFSVPYLSPIDGKIHRYFPDFWVKRKSRAGLVEVVVIEVKPNYQVRPPEVKKKPTARYLKEVATWGINEAKWLAAKDYCEDRKWKFIIMDEFDLGLTPNG